MTDKYLGQRFNSLVVLSIESIKRYTDAAGRPQAIKSYRCKCDCGTETVVRQSTIKKTLSCGCRKTQANAARAVDLTGEKFSRLSVISAVEGRWLCSCSCGGTTITRAAALLNGNTRSCGCLQKEKASHSALTMHRTYRASLGLDPETPLKPFNIRSGMTLLAKKIKQRDAGFCVWCEVSSDRLVAHHLTPWSRDKGLRHSPENLVTLCHACHVTIHKRDFKSCEVDMGMTMLLKAYCNEAEKAILVEKEST